ncbi:AraC family transcriptional regulator [Clostridium sp. MB05]|uniref:AraC family transcriptional regulator n=1 Tax=Clostridium sp. MB05 TaxID=3376682 RepID=UPI003981BDA0
MNNEKREVNMNYSNELIKIEDGLPIKIYIYSIYESKLQCHKEIEIILILKGSLNIRVGNNIYFLKERDLILLNTNEVHNLIKTKEDNIILEANIDIDYYALIYTLFNNTKFDCKSFIYSDDEQKKFDVIRYYLAKIVWELTEKRRGYQFIVGSDINLLGAHLINNFTYDIENKESITKDLARIQNILKYINENLDRKITLLEIANRENLSIYYLSHFIKKNIGISFQEYINNARIDKALNLLLRTNNSITEIAYESGFSSTRTFNEIFKTIYKCSPREYRKSNKYLSSNFNIEYKNEYKTEILRNIFSYLSLCNSNI